MTIEEFFEANKNQKVFADLLRFRTEFKNYSDLTGIIKTIVDRNYKFATDLQLKINLLSKISEGDVIVYKGMNRFVHVLPFDGANGQLILQAGNNGGYHHRNNSGLGTYIGKCGDVITYSKAVIVGTTKILAWFWSEGSAGGERGLVYNFDIKTWEID
jgi:hypothetical protein